MLRQLNRQLDDRLVQKDPGIKLITTGHSLGGGLAEHAAWCFSDYSITAVSFNTSPRRRHEQCYSGATSALFGGQTMASKDESHFQENRIFRLHQHHEILSYLRHAFTTQAPNDERYYFTHGDALTRHGMKALALGLNKLGSCEVNGVSANEDNKKIISNVCPRDVDVCYEIRNKADTVR